MPLNRKLVCKECIEENSPGKHTEGKGRLGKRVLQKPKKRVVRKEGRVSGLPDVAERSGRIRVEERHILKY